MDTCSVPAPCLQSSFNIEQLHVLHQLMEKLSLKCCKYLLLRFNKRINNKKKILVHFLTFSVGAVM